MEFCNHFNNLNRIMDITYFPNLSPTTFILSNSYIESGGGLNSSRAYGGSKLFKVRLAKRKGLI